jgi:hypothetical protein
MPVIARKASATYGSRMSIRPLFAMLVAFAMLFAPLATQGGAAMAMPNTPDHHAQMMESGHCQSLPSKADHHGKTDGKSCCISMCIGLAVAPAAPATATDMQIAPATFTVATIHLPYLGEIATPPPRLG